MMGNAILGEPNADTIECLLFNAKECGAVGARVYRGLHQGGPAAIWSTQGPPSWMREPREWVDGDWLEPIAHG